MTNAPEYDLIIVGGGMVGAACALAAAQAGFRIALLEQQQQPSAPGDDWQSQVSALSHRSQHFLADLGVWSLLKRLTAYQAMRVWEDNRCNEICFQASDLPAPDLGHIVENTCLVAALWQLLSQSEQIDILFGKQITELTCTDQGSQLHCTDQTCLSAGLVIGADGARSTVRELAQIGLERRDYAQQALVTLVRSSEPQYPTTAWQRFLPHGPLALLPLGTQHYAVVWSHSPAQATILQTQPATDFMQQLHQACQQCCGPLHLAGDRFCFPLHRQTALHYVRPGVALIGDAAHVIHPLAGQGVNLGLADAQVLVRTLVAARTRREPLGRFAVLRRYERARQGQNRMTQSGMDALHYLFTHPHSGVQRLRKTGLGLVGRSKVLRRTLERIASGL
jgi:2-octaprenylphenol hydroxylase